MTASSERALKPPTGSAGRRFSFLLTLVTSASVTAAVLAGGCQGNGPVLTARASWARSGGTTIARAIPSDGARRRRTVDELQSRKMAPLSQDSPR
jgi:hypothetical protein